MIINITFASNENRDVGIFSGPPCTSKCLQPALAMTYLELSDIRDIAIIYNQLKLLKINKKIDMKLSRGLNFASLLKFASLKSTKIYII